MKASSLERLLTSCVEVVSNHSDHVTIDKEAAAAWGKSLIGEEVVAAGMKAISFPIRHDSIEAEISFLGLYHLLSFGSGWDGELKATKQGKESAELSQYAAIGIAISGQKVDKHFMRSFSPLHVHNYMSIESHVEFPLPELPGVMISKPGPLHPLVLAYQKAMNDCGEALEAEGAKSLGEFILSNSKEGARASDLVDLLCQSFPPFHDEALCDGRKVQFARKAQALIGSLCQRFGEAGDKRFAFEDMGSLTSDTSPASIAVLRDKGIIKLSEELSALIDNEEELPSGPHERALRAAAVVAADLVSAAGSSFKPFHLGPYLMHLASDAKKHRTKCSSY